MMDDNTPEDYKVGKYKPPLHTRWKKGHCPNPKGRGKGNTSIASCLKKALGKKVTVSDQNGQQKVIVNEALARKLVNLALMEKNPVKLVKAIEAIEKIIEKENTKNLSSEEGKYGVLVVGARPQSPDEWMANNPNDWKKALEEAERQTIVQDGTDEDEPGSSLR